MKNTIVLLLTLTLLAFTAFAAETPVLVEMEKSENWQSVPDSESVSVLWHSDASAILAITTDGAKLLEEKSISYDLLDEMSPNRDFYVVDSKTDALPDGWAGARLKTGNFLVSVPSGTVLPGSRELGYQHLNMTQRPMSAMEPRPYVGYASKDYDPFIQSYVDQVQESYLFTMLTTMVDFVTRYSYTDECVDAVNWAKAEFDSWGYVTELDPHTSGMAPNVIAWKDGAINPDNIWVVGGHFDSTSNNNPSALAPGADDNGTGSALTMYCADLLKDLNFADTIVYALWTGEEQGLYGSDHWAEWASSQGLNILGYYNFDMIGWVEPAPEDLDVLVNNASQGFGQDFVDVADMYTNMLHDLQVANVTASDHYSFWQEGYSAFCAIEDYWPVYPHYHTDQDTVDKVDFPFFAEVTKAMVANICTAAQLAEMVSTGQSYVSCDTVMDIIVIDFESTGAITVQVSSGTEPTPESIILAETGDHMFEGTIQVTDVAPVAGDNMISVTHSDTVTVSFSGVSSTATATVDCVDPVINDVTTTVITSQTSTVSVGTDEDTTCTIRYGEGTPGMEMVGTGYSSSHAMTLENLDDCTAYVYEVEVMDQAGNVTIDNNGGAYYSFTTMERITVLNENMDSDPMWDYQSEWDHGQPTGQGGDYGNPDPTSGYTGNNVVGFNLNGDYPNSMGSTMWATTNTIDCSGSQSLSLAFWAWLGVEQDQYDHAYIEISNNNGSSWDLLWENTDTLNGGEWELWQFDISSQAGGSSQVKIRWGIGPTDSGWRYCGWNIDDVEIFAEVPCTQPTPTPNECINDGDVNQDNEITAGDAQIAFQIALGSFSPTQEEECSADCNGDDQVTAGDAQIIFMTALGSNNCADPV